MWRLVKEAAAGWVEDRATSMGAALAYYTVFSLAPLLLIVISVAGLVFGMEAARGEIVGQLRGLMGQTGAQAIQGMLEHVNRPGAGILATVIGGVTLVVGATTVLVELEDDLDRIWKAEKPKSSGIWNFIWVRLVSAGLILGFGFLLMVSLVLSAALTALGGWLGTLFPAAHVLLQVLNFVVSFTVITGVFAMIYRFLPHTEIHWRDVWVGALITAGLFSLGKFLIGLYIGKAVVASAFGAAGSMVVLLVWIYYSAQIFLLGAEFTKVWANHRGSRRGSPVGTGAPGVRK